MPYPRFFRFLPLLALTATACTAPRTIVSSGKVTPKGEFKAGGNVSFNVATETISQAGGTLKSFAQASAGKDTVRYSASIDRLQAAALAYILDPVQPTADLYLRYGVANRVDVGYKYAFGSHVFDAMYQFLGPTGRPEDRGAVSGGAYGSIGLQFATQRARLPGLAFLDNVTDVLRFRASRNDLIVPLVFSRSFGPEEEKGALSYGLVYSHTFVRYGFEPSKIYNRSGSAQLPGLLSQRNNFSAFGAFASVKLGYRYVYVVPALAIYYQNYGTYQLLNNQTTQLQGVTIIPSLGLQFRVPTGRR